MAAGATLFEIDPRQYKAALDEARGQLDRAQAALGKSDLDVTRYTPLAAQGAVSQQELDDAIQARAANRAEVASAQARWRTRELNFEWTKVTSPIGGVAAIATAQVGDLVSPTTLLTTISQLDPIKVTFPVSEIEYLRFAKRINARSRRAATRRAGPPLELILANGVDLPASGPLLRDGPRRRCDDRHDPGAGRVPEPRQLPAPGQFAKVRAATDRLPDALVIPQRAVSDLQGVNLVAVVGADDKVTQKRVTLGPQTGSAYVVTDGLAAGDRVVVEGLQKIRDGIVVKPVTEAERDAKTAAATAAPAAAE